MGTIECSQPASKSSWDSQDFGDISMVLKWPMFASPPGHDELRLQPYGYVQKFQTQLYICRSTTSLCQGFSVVCVYMHINPD